MSFVNVAPQLVSTAAADAARIGSAINTANTAAAATTQVLAAAQDEVSTAIAALFGSHGQHYQAISAQVAAYQERFVLALSQASSTYAVAEAASATPLQNVLDAINAPVQSLTGRPLIGDGANGIDGTGQAGGNGGWLWGNGGNGGSGAPGQAGGAAGGRVDRQRWGRPPRNAVDNHPPYRHQRPHAGLRPRQSPCRKRLENPQERQRRH